MKFRDPETGKVFDSIYISFKNFCYSRLCDDGGNLCAIGKQIIGGRTIVDCTQWACDNPTEAARLMGYEVIEDTSTDTPTVSDDTPTDGSDIKICGTCAYANRPPYKSPCSECYGFDEFKPKERRKWQMRKILCGGKTPSGEWVEGVPLYARDECRIVVSWCASESDEVPTYAAAKIVDPSTVTQYTCLNDKDGRHIFEGDAILYSGPCLPWDTGANTICVVFWDEITCSFRLKNIATGDSFAFGSACEYKVIGAMYDSLEKILQEVSGN